MDGVGTKKRQWAWAHGLGTRKKFHGLGLTGSEQVAEKCCPTWCQMSELITNHCCLDWIDDNHHKYKPFHDDILQPIVKYSEFRTFTREYVLPLMNSNTSNRKLLIVISDIQNIHIIRNAIHFIPQVYFICILCCSHADKQQLQSLKLHYLKIACIFWRSDTLNVQIVAELATQLLDVADDYEQQENMSLSAIISDYSLYLLATMNESLLQRR
ncbi:unnamed protein product [Didymodactylos carnosus]|uniref:Uncharacterized protein n=1 Tax=Didymodactylos carnosus TaxID=1234261 RepID=A0A814SBS5_9BILA|nr:unnamed protein product [Didymodactylos carnosus]CAF3908687.1 unnamed protein product [Didymodactylos carnosus]